jgi:hypothetical protein
MKKRSSGRSVAFTLVEAQPTNASVTPASLGVPGCSVVPEPLEAAPDSAVPLVPVPAPLFPLAEPAAPLAPAPLEPFEPDPP